MYSKKFSSQQSILLYPQVKECCEISSPFVKSEAIKDEYNQHSCSTYFIDLFTDEGKLNKNAGDKLINLLLKNAKHKEIPAY